MDKLLQNVGELSTPARIAVENLMGHPLRDDQQLYIVALDAAVEPAADQRQTVWNELQAIIADANDKVQQSAESSEGIDRLIDEACDDVLYGT